MSQRFEQLSERHHQLRMLCAIQRESLGRTVQDIEQRLSGVDRGVRIVRGVMRNPALILGVVAVVAMLGPRRLLAWVSKGAVLYTAARRLRGAVQ